MSLVPLEMSVRPRVMDCLRRFPPEVSEATFTNLFAWRRHRPAWILEKHGVLVFVVGMEGVGKAVIGVPHGGWIEPEELKREVPDLKGFIRVPEVAAMKLAAAGIEIVEDEANFDYVYRASDLAELKGEKYHKKRNLVKQCLDAYTCSYDTMTPEIIRDCMATLDGWSLARIEDLQEGHCDEYAAIRELFDHYDELELTGGVITIAGCVQAFAIGEALSPDTAVVHFEKASPSIKGLGQVINQWFARTALAHFTYINREQDLGLPGLRQAKQSYYPNRMVKKWNAMPATW